MSVTTLALPLCKRCWLYHAALDSQVTLEPLRDWRTGVTLHDTLQLLQQHLTARVKDRLQREWDKLETAKRSSVRGYLYRGAKYVLAREHPDETFLKELPREPRSLHVVYPAALEERLVRRRLRLLAKQRIGVHKRGLLLWIAALLPQAPLALTPLPNVTVYYTVYRIVGNYNAWRGAQTLQKAFQQFDLLQRRKLCEQLRELQRAGVVFPEGGWPAKLLSIECDELLQRAPSRDAATGSSTTTTATTSTKSTDAAISTSSSSSSSTSSSRTSDSGSRRQHAARLGDASVPAPTFEGSELLQQAVFPDGSHTPQLTEDAVQRISAAFRTPDLLEHYLRARQRYKLAPQHPPAGNDPVIVKQH